MDYKPKPKLRIKSWYTTNHCGVCSEPIGDKTSHCEPGPHGCHYLAGSLLRELHEQHDTRYNLIESYDESYIKKEMTKARASLAKANARIGAIYEKLHDLRLHCPHTVEWTSNMNAEKEGTCQLCGKGF